MQGQKNQREQFPALTGLRALAAYLVFAHHYPPAPELVGRPLFLMLREGRIGVAVFYTLSGFLIAWTYWDKAQSAQPFWRDYTVKRVARIQPLYLSLLCLAYGAGRVVNHVWPSAFETALNITLLKGFFDEYKFSGIAPAWSLTVEECFYFLAPLLFVLIRRTGFAFTQLLIWCTAGVAWLVGSRVGFHGLFGNAQFVGEYTFFGRSLEFIVGIYCARWLHRHQQIGTKETRSLPVQTFVGFFGVLVCLGFMGFLSESEWFPFTIGQRTFHPAGILINNFVLPFFIGFLLLGLTREISILKRLLSSRFFGLLGRSSYAFYLIQFGFPATLLAVLLRSNLIYFVAVNVLAILAYLYLEHPANLWIRRKWLRPERAATAATPLV